MIPTYGCDPNINIVKLGAEILRILDNKSWSIEELLVKCSKAFDVSVDHIILTLDWLFTISAIKLSETKVFPNVFR